MRNWWVVILFLLSSCIEKQNHSQKFIATWPGNFDTSNLNFIKNYRGKFLDNLDLNDISTGTDSFEIRFGYNYTLFVEKDLFVIKNVNGNWNGVHFAYQHNGPNDSISFNKKEFVPLTNWKGFIDSIYTSKILNIPSQIDLKGYKNRVNDGKYLMLEYATKNNFKLILYENPDKYPEFPESQIVLGFIDMFYRNISAKERCWPRCQN